MFRGRCHSGCSTLAFLAVTLGLLLLYAFLSFHSTVHSHVLSYAASTGPVPSPDTSGTVEESKHKHHSPTPEELKTAGYDLINLTFFTSNASSVDAEFTVLEAPGVHTLHDVCIEDTVYESAQRRMIVAYNQPPRTLGTHTVKPHISANSKIQSWKITFKTGPVPSTHRVVSSHPAYFISPSCPGNLYHFWTDSTRLLYGTLKATNRLNASDGNQVFYPASFREWARESWDGNSCYNPLRFQELLLTLGVRPWHGWYGYAPTNTCYTNAVFGYIDSNINEREAENYVMAAMGYMPEQCPTGPTVTILQRKTRRILNAEQLQNASKALGLSRTFLYEFEDLPVREQFKIASCSDILIGVQGAGMAWLYFMPNTSGLIEIAWPQKQWISRYKNRALLRGMKAASILNPEVYPNWEVFAKREGHGIPFSEDLKQRLLEVGTVYRWADTKVDVGVFTTVLANLTRQLGLSQGGHTTQQVTWDGVSLDCMTSHTVFIP